MNTNTKFLNKLPKKVKKELALNKMSEEIYNKIKSYKEYHAAKTMGEMIGTGKKVLNIGSTWGRDYYYLTHYKNCDVTNLDITDWKLPNLTKHNLEDLPMPFKKNSFDVVLISAVLEHVWNDWEVVRDISRMLKPNGKIVVNIPYMEDTEITHIRVYTVKSIIKLLELNGFKIKDHKHSGITLKFSYLINGIRKVLKIDLTDKFLKLENKLNWFNKLKLIQILDRGSVCYISATKGKIKNISQVNSKRFSDMNCTKGVR